MSLQRIPILFGAVGLVVFACTKANTRADPVNGVSVETAMASITADDMRERIAFLASDEMAGRDTPSEGLEAAARYLSQAFDSFGLEPGGDGDGFLQRYPFPLRALDASSVRLALIAADGAESEGLSHGVDFWARPALQPPDGAVGRAPLLRLGRLDAEGISSGVRARGQVIVVDLPGPLDGDWRAGEARARAHARTVEAAGLVIALDASFPSTAIAQFADLASRPRREVVDPGEIPTFYVAHDPARALVTGAEVEFAATPTVFDAADAPNVVAILEGSDPALKDTYVVFSAHMDHVGVGTADATGDSIYNGADDDASGTAALVEVAQAFAMRSERPARSLLFLAVSGEEKGLLGSRYYSDHPTVPVERIVANINVDMIARNAPDSIVVIGQEYSSLGPLVNDIARRHPELGLVVGTDPWPEEGFFFRSDHYNFARLEIPALFFFAGVHEDYHRPSDEIDKIDADKAARVARLIFLTAGEIANGRDRPSWTETGLAEIRALTR